MVGTKKPAGLSEVAMRIVIDLQGAQTESRFRGIGRYTLSLAQAIVRNRGEHEIIIVLNGLLQDTIEPIRAAFHPLLPRENIRIWYAPGPVREREPDNTWRREAAELAREAFLVSLKPDVVHVSSLFEGYLDDAVTSIGLFDRITPTVVTLYDLIPLLNPDHYLHPNPKYEHYYLTKIHHLKKAAAWLGISKFSAREGQDILGLNEQLVFNISTACDPQFKQIQVSLDEERTLRQRLALNKSFLVCAGGSDSRKNLHRLIQAYALLSGSLRQTYQLLLVGKMPEGDIRALQATAKSAGLRKNELVFAGYVTDEDLVRLFNLCKLFVFPSWHEGFGLPALEAMSCGAPVIGANTSSLPEVIGREDALFDPFSQEAIAEKIAQVLGSEDFREDLSRYALKQSQLFSWDESGRRAIKAAEQVRKREKRAESNLIFSKRPKLAYVSPLPPERTGIADYSAELLPALGNYYDIEVIGAQSQISDPWITANYPVRSVEWFTSHADDYQRVLYHFGNSPFHRHMFGLLEQIPGVVCLHDFFVSGYSRYMEVTGKAEFYWCRDLYLSHGYKAVRERFQARDDEKVMYEYPCNFSVLRSANGIIVHSDYSRRLAYQWYGSSWGQDWVIIPLTRKSSNTADRENSRTHLGIDKGAFVVCSFGFLAHTKLSHRLLAVWLASELAKNLGCYLIFVGENHGGEYGRYIVSMIDNSGVRDRIRITGWVGADEFRRYLVVADMAVQFRTLSRGETSAAVLDCMNHALPTIVNANGSLADLPRDAVWMLDDEFADADLVIALETLWRDEMKRKAIGARAREVILNQHTPEICARRYAEAIEEFYRCAELDRCHLARTIATQDSLPLDERAWLDLASCIAQNQPERRPARNLFVDVTATSRNDLKTGIERVARALLLELISAPPAGYRVEPVYLTDQGGRWHYRYARHYTLMLLDCPDQWLEDELIEVQAGDILFAPDMAGSRVVEAEKAGLYRQLKDIGVGLYFMVHDLLPVTMPSMFPPGASEGFEMWLSTLYRIADGVICVTKSVADDLRHWSESRPIRKMPALQVDWSHHGADLIASAPSQGFPSDSRSIISMLGLRPTFLMVGTIEPRKGHMQVIAAFEHLWQQDMDINLVVVGKEGWQGLPDEMRRTIPRIVDILRHHPELGNHLFWLEGISDEYLEKIYAASTCLIAASEGEGFGLPLIEAAQHRLPIIARDIPVFREVAGKHAFYFKGMDPKDLEIGIKKWISLYEQGQHQKSEVMPWLTWGQSVEILKNILFKHTETWRMKLEKQILIDGKNFFVSSDDHYLDHMGGNFEPHMVTLFKKIVLPTDVVVDVGANIGLTTILFSLLGRKVVSFEASPSTYSILGENMNRNAINNAVLVNIGLGDKTETTTITFAADNRSGGFVSDMVRPEGGHVTESIELRKLDDIWCVFGEPLNFIKIDVEGFEGNVIKGARGVIEKFKPTVVLELNHWCLNAFRRITVPDFFDYLRSVFPVLYAVDSDNTSIMNLHIHDEAYYVMHEHIVKWRFLNIVAGFDEALIKRLRYS